MKLTWRIWVLVFVLSFALMSVLNLPGPYIALVGILVISIPVSLTFIKSKNMLIFSLVIIALLLIIIPLFTFSSGVMVTSVNPSSVAFSEGLRKGMIISEINGVTIKNSDDFFSIINSVVESEGSKKFDIQTEKERIIFLTNSSIGVSVKNIPKTNLKTGLDLSGGARAMIRPANVSLNSNEISDLVVELRKITKE